jgi:hypothetical protein
MKSVNLKDLRNLDKNQEIKSRFNDFMLQKYRELWDDKAAEYFNTNPEFRGLLKTVRKWTLHIKDVLSFFDEKDKEQLQENINQQVNILVSANDYFHEHQYLIENQKKKWYTLTPSQVDNLITAMGKATSHFHTHQYLIENQKEKWYELTPDQVDRLIRSMEKAKSHFHTHQYLIENQKEKWYELTPDQVDSLVISMAKTDSEWHVLEHLIKNQKEKWYKLMPNQIKKLKEKIKEE